MAIDSYHHWAEAVTPPEGADEAWLAARLADARATLLHRLEFTSARLRLRGLRLRVLPPAAPAPLVPTPPSVGMALTLVGATPELRVREGLYRPERDGWTRCWSGYSLIGVTRDDSPETLPDDLVREAAAWLRVFRGHIEDLGAADAVPRGPRADPSSLR
ncbi:hypothetical protein KBTX_00229 [wastewater metagenome]|uniref:Uncharacterized protein n=2 Tax=unclassified sequences TaxID=12908 RepID=A0A5B8R7F8_9ZZZZ|nr:MULTISPECIES: hypothetical protein [Arhodomonas]MCS4504130.1 hypothetical protein [Arhodomonas aquaeolei]QEA03928.1 hypothetical protein KBTEX_00229 [uncultured organism]